MKKNLALVALAASIALIFPFQSLVAGERWLHVRVEEGGARGETVSVNVPLSVVESMLPLIHIEELEGGKLNLDIEENDFVAGANFDERPFPEVLDEFSSVRAASLTFYRSLNQELAQRRGVANELEFSVRSVPYIVAGHERHHVRVLRERYLGIG